MKTFTAQELFRRILPVVTRYGRYALQIQRGVHAEDKGSADENPVVRAFTDADQILQEGISKELLQLQKEGFNFSLLAEEDSPYNQLFPPDQSVLVTVDPIDGTILYKQGLSGWSTIINVFKDGRLEGFSLHTPQDGLTYVATQDLPQSQIWTPQGGVRSWEIRPIGKQMVASMNVPAKTREALRQRGVQVYELGSTEIQPPIEVNSMFRGEILDGYFLGRDYLTWTKMDKTDKGVPAIDWGPTSLFVEKGGGYVSDFEGKKDDIHQYWGRKDGLQGRISSIIAVSSESLHKTLVEVLSAE